MKVKGAGFGVVSMMVVLVMSGCSPFIVSASGEQPTPIVEELAAEQPAGKLAADSLPCPQDAEGMQFYADEAHGFCLLVPDGFEINQSSDNQLSLVGAMTESGVPPLGYIIISDAEGKTAAEIAAPEIEQAQGMGMNVAPQDITVGGEPAVMVDGLPGQDVTRKVFVVHGGMAYQLAFTPADPNMDGYDSLMALYDAVIGSFNFLR
jgi:hypothetical protein